MAARDVIGIPETLWFQALEMSQKVETKFRKSLKQPLEHKADICHHLVEHCQVEGLEFFRVELHRQRGAVPCEALQLLDEIPALGQGKTSASPSHLDSSLCRKLLANRGDQTVILNF